MVSLSNEYVVMKCLDCGYKDIHINGMSDGKRCERCNSGMYFSIDSGSKKEMISKYNIKTPGQNKTHFNFKYCNSAGV